MALIICPECGKEISSKAKICIHCGYPLKEMQEEQQKKEERYWEVPFSVQDCVKDENGIAGPEPEELSGLRKIECPSCGKEVSAKAIDCPHCGGSINSRAEGIKWGDVASIFVAAFFLIPILVQFFRGL